PLFRSRYGGRYGGRYAGTGPPDDGPAGVSHRPSRGHLAPDGLVPGQRAALHGARARVDEDTYQSRDGDQRVHVGDGVRGLRDGDAGAQSGRTADEFGGDREDEGHGGGEPYAGHDVGQGGRPQHMADPGPGAEAVGAGGLLGHGVGVLDPVQDLDEDLPEGGVDDQQQGGAQIGAEQQDGEGDQGHRGDGPQELDGAGRRLPQIRDDADHQARGDAGGGGDEQPERPAGQGVAEGGPEGGVGHLPGQGGGDGAGGRQVVGGDEPEPGHRLDQGEEAAEPGEAEQGVARPGPPSADVRGAGPHRCAGHGSSV